MLTFEIEMHSRKQRTIIGTMSIEKFRIRLRRGRIDASHKRGLRISTADSPDSAGDSSSPALEHDRRLVRIHDMQTIVARADLPAVVAHTNQWQRIKTVVLQCAADGQSISACARSQRSIVRRSEVRT